MRAHISFLTYVSIPWFHAYPLLFPPRVKCILWRGEFQSFRCSIPSPLIPKSKFANFSSTSFVRFLSPTILQNIRARISNFRSQTSILSALYHLVREEYRVDRWARFSFFFPFLFPDQKLEPPFVNGNIEKSYKFGAVYPQNFTFSNIWLVSICIRNGPMLRIHIRKIRIYGESYRELSQSWWKGRNGNEFLETVLLSPRCGWKFSKKLSTRGYLHLRVKSQRQSCSG